jgi:hypothetical protein
VGDGRSARDNKRPSTANAALSAHMMSEHRDDALYPFTRARIAHQAICPYKRRWNRYLGAGRFDHAGMGISENGS